MSSIIEEYVSSPEGMRAYQQERAIYEVTSLVEQVMEEQGVSRSDLADRLGKSRGWVTQLLDGEANKTVRTLADVFAVLGRELQFNAGCVSVGSSPKCSSALNGDSRAKANVANDATPRQVAREKQ